MIYLDNASTTLKKPLSVYKKTINAMIRYNANPGRSGHFLSTKAGFEVYRTREIIAKLFNGNPENVIFTSGCSESLNLAIRGTVKDGGHIITTAYEHNSVLRVLKHLENEGKITFTIVNPREDKKIYAEDIEKEIKNNTYAVIVNHISNVIGVEQNIFEIGKMLKKHNLLYIVDSAQSAGHKKIDIKKCNISLVAFAGHKGLLGLSGVGGLIVNENVQLSPIKFGGTGTSSESLIQPNTMPDGFESGTLPLINIISLQAGVNYVMKNFDKINDKISHLTAYLLEKLSNLNNITVYTPKNELNGVVAFNIKDHSASDVSNFLNEKYKICVRSGLACAPMVNKFLGTLKSGGVVRVSISHYNNLHQINKLLKALAQLK